MIAAAAGLLIQLTTTILYTLGHNYVDLSLHDRCIIIIKIIMSKLHNFNSMIKLVSYLIQELVCLFSYLIDYNDNYYTAQNNA